jgi:AraC-like DNA-binding protein
VPDSHFPWEMFLRGTVAGLLLFHLLHLGLPGARPAARLALGGFTLTLLAYLFCQEPHLMHNFHRPLALALMALCVSSTAWMWVAARSLFNDGFRFSPPVVSALVAMVTIGLASKMPYLFGWVQPQPGGLLAWLSNVHAAAMLAFTGAALWEIVGNWQDDLVEPRRAARRWGAMLIGVYAAVAVVVELALQDRPVGRLLPLLHVAGIGTVTLALALLVARRSLQAVLGGWTPPQPDPDPLPPHEVTVPPGDPPHEEAPAVSPNLDRLNRAMTEQHLFRREGLTLGALAEELGMGEAALRTLINQQLGYRNFNDFLHHYRLQEAAARLASEDLPILTIALECGYGSIGPFNRAFRQRMGMTPSEYRGASRLSPGQRTN